MIRSIIRATVVLACVSTAAHAQLGSLIKKAAGKIENKAENKVSEKPLEGEPLTASALDAVLKGLSLETETKEKSKQLWAAIEAKSKEVTEADRATGDEPDKWHKASRDIQSCVSRSIDESNKKHEQEMPQKMMALSNDPNLPAVTAELQKATKRMDDARAKGEKLTEGAGPWLAYTKAMANYEKLIGFEPAKDSAVGYAKCGKPPAKPASMVKLEGLKAEVERLTEERRAAEAESGARAAKAAGMPADKYALARERLLTWNTERKAKDGKRSVTKDEDALFKSRAADIKKVEAALR
jgi:hypothetical protein